MLDLASALLAAATLISSTTSKAFDWHLDYPFPSITHTRFERPSIRLWITGDDVLRYGESADVYFRADDDAFVAVVRIDTDGRLHLLYPESANISGRVRGGRTYLASFGGYGSLTTGEPAGMGFVFAIASHEPFDFDNLGFGNSGLFADLGRIGGDPFFEIEDLAKRLLDADADYALDYIRYHVGRRMQYPMYVNYDCYAGGISLFWNPFSYRCRDYDVTYNHSHYYSKRHNSGRVVYMREPARPSFDFKTEPGAGTGSNESSVGYRGREDNRDYRRPGSPASDPNVPARGAESRPGSTRPGDDVSNGREGRRRVIVRGNEERERTGRDARPPRRDGAEQRSPGTPRRDDRKSEPPGEPASDRDRDRSRRFSRTSDRPSSSAEQRNRGKDTKTAQQPGAGESRRRRTPDR
ncbi:MAG: DUF4384 domain-containing protein [Gemmatimonadaceae bacterium]